MFKTLFIILIILAVLEYLTTAYGLLSKKAQEVNPLFKWVKEEFGIFWMLISKLFGTIAVFLGVWMSQSFVVVYVLGTALLLVCAWNIRTIIKSRNIN